MYYIIQAKDGLIDADQLDILECHYNADEEKAYVRVVDGVEERSTWIRISEDEFLSKKPNLQILQLDKQQEAIDAIMDGLIDTATQNADANDAIMSALIDLQAQIDELKNGGTN
jgi:hypothetical protein